MTPNPLLFFLPPLQGLLPLLAEGRPLLMRVLQTLAAFITPAAVFTASGFVAGGGEGRHKATLAWAQEEPEGSIPGSSEQLCKRCPEP